MKSFLQPLCVQDETEMINLCRAGDIEARNILELARYANVHTQQPLTTSELKFIYYYPDIAAKVMTVSPYINTTGAMKERIDSGLITAPGRII